MFVVSFFFRRSNWKIAQGNFLSPCKFRKENRDVAGSVGGGFGTVMKSCRFLHPHSELKRHGL